MPNSYKKKNIDKTIFYLVYSPPEHCAHNELEFELESKLSVSDSRLQLVMNEFKMDVQSWAP